MQLLLKIFLYRLYNQFKMLHKNPSNNQFGDISLIKWFGGPYFPF